MLFRSEIRALLSHHELSHHDEDAQEHPFDAILLASGRTPNVDDLGLDAAGIDYGPNGIKVDGTLRTSNDAVFAVGDVTAGLTFTHAAANAFTDADAFGDANPLTHDDTVTHATTERHTLAESDSGAASAATASADQHAVATASRAGRRRLQRDHRRKRPSGPASNAR